MTRAKNRPRLDTPTERPTTAPRAQRSSRSEIDLSAIPNWVEIVTAKVKLELCRENFAAARKIIRRAEAKFYARRMARARGLGVRKRKNMPDGAKLDLHVGSLGMSIRTSNGLESEGISKVRALVAMTRAGVLKVPNFGAKAVEEVERALWKLGLELRADPNDDFRRGPVRGSVLIDDLGITRATNSEVEAEVAERLAERDGDEPAWKFHKHGRRGRPPSK